MSTASSTTPNKVLLWSSPRSMSTVFLKCMTYVPNTVAWHEPWLQVRKFGKDRADPLDNTFREMVDKLGGQAAVDQIEGGFDARNATFEWIKEQLEGDFPEKTLVFVKEIAYQVIKFTDTIPVGFRHTFIIRHPIKYAQSIGRIMAKMMKLYPGKKIDASSMPKMTPYKDTYDLLQHVKENHDPNPVIIDADDLLANPAQMLEAYCKAVNIPYSADLLRWEAGDDVLKSRWMVPKETILTANMFDFHESTFKTTTFEKRERQAPPEISEVHPQMRAMIEAEIPYFDKLYAERLIVPQ